MPDSFFQELDEIELPDELPVLPLKDLVVVPMAVAPVVVGQPRTLRLLESVMKGPRMVALVAQRENEHRPAEPEDLFRVGTAGIIHQALRAPDGTLRVIVQGLERIRIGEFSQTDPWMVAKVERWPDDDKPGLQSEALLRVVRSLFEQLVASSEGMPEELIGALNAITDARQVTYLVVSSAPFSAETRQELLEAHPLDEKMRRLVLHLQRENALRDLEQKIASDTREQLTRTQKEYFLREHLKSIQRELGDEEEGADGSGSFAEQLAKLDMPEEARKEAEREIARLEHIPAASPEHGMVRTYLEWIVSLPWGKVRGGPIEVPRAREVLDEDHYDLEKVKDRVLEHLAVKKLREERAARRAKEEEAAAKEESTSKSKDTIEPPPGPEPAAGTTQVERTPTPHSDENREPLLCFVGPPGVGKTSLGQSIARAMGRSFVRISLGGVHDEAEIRGHRRTYIGAMPGRILQALRRGGSSDPVFMLDEVDKLGVGFHGDPSAALLEVLDPAQNKAFVDSYLGVPFDLTQVLFICTANTTETIPPPLLDRMEVIGLAGYTEEEKRHIARRFLLPKQLRAQGLEEGEVILSDDVLRRISREYTREAGVRNLERSIAAVLRKAARRITEGVKPPIRIDDEALRTFLGPQKFFDEVAERIDRPGVATGLAWTPAGGDLLFVEAAAMPGQRERLLLTGMLGDVMRESATAALTWLRSNGEALGLHPDLFAGKVVHVHVPAGAIPKDGPSAGVTIAAALASLASCRPVLNDVAMTGEITLRGKVLPVGGIKEKALAAHRAGVSRMILPRRSEGQLEEVPEEVRNELRFELVDSIEEVIQSVLSPEVDAEAETTQEAQSEESPPAPPTVH